MLDVNDNFPLFSSDNYEFSVAENTDTLTFSVSATDKDDGTNADITYQFTDGNTNNSFLIGEPVIIQNISQSSLTQTM